ncbi:TIGR01777 family oxidoreductase [Planotetraspora sp. A-T 1434]|uniref:TIGR01777 family oxidoreductase n=1 Tax=Planotetraspora sp. A-T 1434 TaxID=2979219 RepID=UPI0021BE0C9B|nr:TIGR01777 family oxidoreductase [Planotetraspora sp. A-T 1434]MCT9930061.1 TIGR01777 family oxidoreductase [Planotetraspora sp. A-T 1434]
MTIVVTGSSGLLGSALVRALRADGDQVLRLVRREPAGPDEAFWDPARGVLDPAVLEGVDAVVHLAGAGIGDRRWTESYKRELVDSRVNSTRTLAEALAALAGKPRVLLSGSAVGFYGDTGDRSVDESSPSGAGFLAGLVREWEAAAAPAEEAGIRVVRLRTGIVLSGRGGALAKVLPIFKLGAGAVLGSGKQYVSWISLPDWVAAIRFLLNNQEMSAMSGPVNVTAPEPVTNAEYTRAIGKALHRPTMPIATPAFALRLALGEFATEGVLAGQRVLPRRLLDAGHRFAHPALEDALAAVL